MTRRFGGRSRGGVSSCCTSRPGAVYVPGEEVDADVEARARAEEPEEERAGNSRRRFPMAPKWASDVKKWARAVATPQSPQRRGFLMSRSSSKVEAVAGVLPRDCSDVIINDDKVSNIINDSQELSGNLEAAEEASADLKNATVYDVIADTSGELVLLPICPGGKSRPMADLQDSEVVSFRVFRFFEDLSDESRACELDLRNMNTGSLLWLAAHMEPKMHSVQGAKYGTWFTVHVVSARVGQFKAGYHMCEEGRCAGTEFGTTPSIRKCVSGRDISSGYFWFSSPAGAERGDGALDVKSDACMQKHGWRHVSRQGPFCGKAFLQEWKKLGEPIEEASLQQILRKTISRGAVQNK